MPYVCRTASGRAAFESFQDQDLKVISRTSVMQYKSGVRRNLKEIAHRLGVSNVVEGSVRRSGDHSRFGATNRAKTDRHIWVQNYDRTLTDSLALEANWPRRLPQL